MEQKNHNTDITFLLADDHSIVRQGMEITINEYVPNSVTLHASTLEQLVDKLKSEVIDIAVVDAYFPDGNSLSILPELKIINPELKILIFSALEEKFHALKFINAGANGYLSKSSEEDEVIEAVLGMVNYGKYFSVIVQKLLLQYANDPNSVNPLAELTKRELEIAELYSEGYGNLEIAHQLHIKQNTVSTIKKNIFVKLNITNLVELIELLKTYHKM